MEISAKQRPKKNEFYLNLAEKAALRSTCLRRNFGAVIVNHDQVISIGYSGAPRKLPNCDEVGFCFRGELGAKRGEHYEFCRAIHAEQNAIIQAPREQMLDGVLYLVGLDARTKEPIKETEPCRICKRLIVNAGIKSVVARQGHRQINEYSVEEWLTNNLYELKKEGGKFVAIKPPRTVNEAVDEERVKLLLSRFHLADAVIVQNVSYDQAKQAVGRMAAQYFVSNVKTGNSVAISCGDTLLCMLEFLPYLPKMKIIINQLSIEADPTMIHQAPATLTGLLRAKCSDQSKVYGIQLPPFDLVDSASTLRKELAETKIFRKLKKMARRSDYVFLGVGSAGSDSASFWSMAQAATGGKFARFVREVGVAGEINNQIYDETGKNCSRDLPGFDKQVLNILSLEDIREMASKPGNHKVVLVANGTTKTKAIRSALESGLGNILITSREDADRLLEGKN